MPSTNNTDTVVSSLDAALRNIKEGSRIRRQPLTCLPGYFHQLQDPNGNVIAFLHPTRPTSYPGLGDVYTQLHYVRTAGAGVVVRLVFSPEPAV